MKDTYDRKLRAALVLFALLDLVSFVPLAFRGALWFYEQSYNLPVFFTPRTLLPITYVLLVFSFLPVALGLLASRRWAILLYVLGLPCRFVSRVYSFGFLFYFMPWWWPNGNLVPFRILFGLIIFLEAVRLFFSLVAFRRISKPEWPRLFSSWTLRSRRTAFTVAACVLVIATLAFGWDRRTPVEKLNDAVRNGYLRSARDIVATGIDLNNVGRHHLTPVEEAVSCARPEFLEFFLNHGADANLRTQVSASPLERLLTFKFVPYEDERLACLTLLIDHGADVNAPDKDGNTPLHHAATCNSPEAVRILLDHGAKVDAVDPGGNTPLLWVATFGCHRALDPDTHSDFTPNEPDRVIQVMQILLDHGANINARNKNGWSVLKTASSQPDRERKIVSFLKSRGAVE